MFEFDKDFEMELGQSSVRKRSNKFMLLWKLDGNEVSGSISSSPLLHGNLLIFGCTDHSLYALDSETGKLAWRFRAGQIFVDMKPIENDGMIYAGSYDGFLYAIAAETGKEIWRFRTGGRIYGSCTVSNGKVYFGSEDSYVYAIDARSGKEIWRFKTGAEVGSAPSIYRGVLYIGSYDENLYALDSESGREIGRFKTGGNVSNPLPYSVDDGILYMGCTDGNVYAVRVPEMREEWRFRTGGWILASPKPAAGLVYVISSDGNMYCINKEGKQAWKFMTDAYMDGSTEALVHEGALYYGSSNGNFYALDRITGEEMWRFRTDGEIISSPAIRGGKVYFGSFDCNMYCINLSGKEVWRFRTGSGVKWKLPPASEWFEFEVDLKEEQVEEAREYGAGVNIARTESLESDYHFRSEYRFKSEYHTKSEYR